MNKLPALWKLKVTLTTQYEGYTYPNEEKIEMHFETLGSVCEMIGNIQNHYYADTVSYSLEPVFLTGETNV